MEKEYTYSAFISYSSKDEKVAKALWKKLEHYRLPSVLQKQYEDIPEKMHIFLDQGDIVPGDTVENALSRELADSKKLIVICSHNSAKSPYVELEVKNFLSLGHSPNDIIPYIIEGEVNRDSPNNCYVPSLFGKTDKETINGVSVLRDGKWKAFVGVLANLLDVKFDEIYRREKVRRNRINAALSGLGLLFACFIGLAVWYVMPHTRYYRDYITKWGIPVGIYQLDKKQVKRESEHYQITTRYGRPIKLVHANNRGEPENQLHFLNHFNRPKIATYKYENGFMPFVSMKNWKLTSVYYTINSGDFIDGDKEYSILLEYNENTEEEDSVIVDFYYGKGTRERKSLSNNFLSGSCFFYSDVRKLIVDDDIFIQQFDLYPPDLYFIKDVSSIFQFRIKYNNIGYEKEVDFYNYTGNEACDKNKIKGYINNYDSKGRIIKQELLLKAASSLIPTIINYEYDKNGYINKLEYIEKEQVIQENKERNDFAINKQLLNNTDRNFAYYDYQISNNKQVISFFDKENNYSDCCYINDYKIETINIDEFTVESNTWNTKLQQEYPDIPIYQKTITHFLDNTIEYQQYLVVNGKDILESLYSEKSVDENTTEIYSEEYDHEKGETLIQHSITEINNINGMRIEKNTVYDSLTSDLGNLNYSMCYDSHERLISETINKPYGLIEAILEYKGENRSISFYKDGTPYLMPYLNYSQSYFGYDNNNQLITSEFKDENNKFVTSYLGFSKCELKYNLHGLKLKQSFYDPFDNPILSSFFGYSQFIAEDSYNHNYLISLKYIDENGKIIKPDTESFSHMISEVVGRNRKDTYYTLNDINHIDFFENDELVKASYYGYDEEDNLNILYKDNKGRYIGGDTFNNIGTLIKRKIVEYGDDYQKVTDYWPDNISTIDSIMINYDNGECIFEKNYKSGKLKWRSFYNSDKQRIRREEYDEFDGSLINELDYEYSDENYYKINSKSYKNQKLIKHGYYYEKNINNNRLEFRNGKEGYSGVLYYFDDENIERKIIKKVSKEHNTGVYYLSGAFVNIFNVFPKTQAEKNGLKINDIIVKFNDFDYFSSGTEYDLEVELNKGQTIKKEMIIYRPSEEKFYKIQFEPGTNGFQYGPMFAADSITESEEKIRKIETAYNNWMKQNH